MWFLHHPAQDQNHKKIVTTASSVILIMLVIIHINLPNTDRNMGGNVRQIISNSSVHTFYIITDRRIYINQRRKRSNASPNLYSTNKDQRSSHCQKKNHHQMTRHQKKERKKEKH
jgi:hypothetical protein